VNVKAKGEEDTSVHVAQKNCSSLGSPRPLKIAWSVIQCGAPEKKRKIGQEKKTNQAGSVVH
jgi:hypothetical protein